MKASLTLGVALLALLACATTATAKPNYVGHINVTAQGVPVAVDVALTYAPHGKPFNNRVALTLKGPANVWFGIGFDAEAMADLPYTVYMSPLAGGAAALVVEQKLGDHAAGTQLKQQFTLVSDTADTQANTRSSVLDRSMAGSDADHYTFDVAKLTKGIPVIVAYGTSADFGYHKAHATATLKLHAVKEQEFEVGVPSKVEAGPCALKCTAEALALNAKCSAACVKNGGGLACETGCKMQVLKFDIPCLKACRKHELAAAAPGMVTSLGRTDCPHGSCCGVGCHSDSDCSGFCNYCRHGMCTENSDEAE